MGAIRTRPAEIVSGALRTRGKSGFEDLKTGEGLTKIPGVAGDQAAAVRREGPDQDVSNGSLRMCAGTSCEDVRMPRKMRGLGIRH